jgi:hypothetical protein
MPKLPSGCCGLTAERRQWEFGGGGVPAKDGVIFLSRLCLELRRAGPPLDLGNT